MAHFWIYTAIIAMIAAIIAQIFASKVMRFAAFALRNDKADSIDKHLSTRLGQFCRVGKAQRAHAERMPMRRSQIGGVIEGVIAKDQALWILVIRIQKPRGHAALCPPYGSLEFEFGTMRGAYCARESGCVKEYFCGW